MIVNKPLDCQVILKLPSKRSNGKILSDPKLVFFLVVENGTFSQLKIDFVPLSAVREN